MKTNVGSKDKLARIILAIIFVLLYSFKLVTGVMGVVFLVLAGVFLLTAFINYCPIWHFLGISTEEKSNK